MGREVRRVAKDWVHPLDSSGKSKRLFADEMPDFSDATHYQMYETTTEGTPISPVMETPEALAKWLVENKTSAFARQTASYEAWLKVCRGKPSISGVLEGSQLVNGVEVRYKASQRQGSQKDD